MHLRLVACEVLYREAQAAAAASPNRVDIDFLPQGLHNLGREKMRFELQAAVDRADSGGYDAILLGFALCGLGLAGVRAGKTRLVIPRAHDCIALFFGSRSRYRAYFEAHPGTYYRTSGWIERIGAGGSAQLFPGEGSEFPDREELVRKFGEEDAADIIAELSGERNYDRVTFIETGLEPDGELEGKARAEAAAKGWTFDKVRGDLAWIRRLTDGPWGPDEFLEVAPGWSVAQQFDDLVIKAVPPE